MNDQIALALAPVSVDLAALTIDPANSRVHGSQNIETIKASFKRFGQRIPIVVQKEGMIVRAGNGRVMAARDLGWKTIAAVIVDENSVEATAFAITDNRSAELATWDQEVLARTLESLSGSGLDLDLLGFSKEDLSALELQFGDVGGDLDLGVVGEVPTPAERLLEWQKKGIRTIILPFDMETYAKVTTMFAAYREKHGLDSNAIAVFALLESAQGKSNV